MTQRQTLSAGALLGGLAVAIGAFGAHAFKAMLTASGRTETYELAVRYQFFHALALLIVGLLMHHTSSAYLRYASNAFLTGILFFSGSLYILCFSGLGILGAVTPIGGVFLMVGWVLVFIGVSAKK